MKICYVSGNAPRVFKLMEDMIGRGHEIHWIPIGSCTSFPDGVIIHNPIQINKGNYIEIFIFLIYNYFLVKKIINKISPDILHAINIKWAGWFSVLSNYKPVIVTAQGQDVMISQNCDMDIFRKTLRYYTIKNANVITYGSNTMFIDIKKWASPKKSFKYYQGVDFTIYNHKLDATEYRNKLDLKNHKVVFSPRMFTENSNLDIIIKSIPLVKSVFSNVKFIFSCHLETNNYSEKMKNLISNLELKDNCILLDTISNDEMPYYYALSDTIVSILTSDGMPATLIEAMAMKKILVVSKIPTYIEIATEIENMLFVELRDVNSTAQKIIEALSGSKHYIKDNAYKWVCKNGNSKILNDNIEKLYKNLI